MIEIRRLEASEAELWVEAVSEIISPGAREERLISLTETEAVPLLFNGSPRVR